MDEETQENRSGSAAGERRPQRRRHSLAQKLAIVREYLEPGLGGRGSVSARCHGPE